MEATEQRLRAAAPHIIDAAVAEAFDRPADLLAALAEKVKLEDREDVVWLLVVALTGTFPRAETVRSTRRTLRLSPDGLAAVALMKSLMDFGSQNLDVEMDVLSDSVIVDVDFCAKYTANTGIQRVVRQTMARWDANYDIVPVAWTESAGAMRGLSEQELSRVTAWHHHVEPDYDQRVGHDEHRLIVPFRSVVILPEVPQPHLCDALAALAEFSGNRIGLIGYDAIPIVSADTVPSEETERFVHYLTIIKHSDRVAGISAASTDDFLGFSNTLAAQGLPPVHTLEVRLPVDLPDREPAQALDENLVPLVLCVGSQEPRKNQDAVLFASEILWREGFSFRLRFIGGGSLWFTRGFDKRVRELAKRGRLVEVWRGVKDDALLDSYASASFSIFPSLHEGYGLPVAESLAMGVPVITTGYGSTAEIAIGGGCVLVDPKDDASIIDAMRSLIEGPDRIENLRAEIATRSSRTWDDYAEDLWANLVQPLVAAKTVSA